MRERFSSPRSQSRTGFPRSCLYAYQLMYDLDSTKVDATYGVVGVEWEMWSELGPEPDHRKLPRRRATSPRFSA